MRLELHTLTKIGIRNSNFIPYSSKLLIDRYRIWRLIIVESYCCFPKYFYSLIFKPFYTSGLKFFSQIYELDFFLSYIILDPLGGRLTKLKANYQVDFFYRPPKLLFTCEKKLIYFQIALKSIKKLSFLFPVLFFLNHSKNITLKKMIKREKIFLPYLAAQRTPMANT